MSSDAPRIWPFLFGFHASPNLCCPPSANPSHDIKTRIGPFLSLANEPNIRLAHATTLRLARVLCAIKDEHLARHGLGRDQVWVLRHVARAVDLPSMVYPLHDVDACLRRRQRMPAELAALLVVRATVEHVRARPGARWDLHGRDLEVVCRLPGRVGAYEQAVGRVRFVGRAASGGERSSV
jgi:hypothetical protein